MNTELCSNWTGFSASIPGSGHIRHGLPCQDASAAVTSPRPALIVCDGRGSASRSQDGAQAAVKAFLSQIAVFEPMLANILDNESDSCQEQWQMFARIMYRTLMQTKLDLAKETELPECGTPEENLRNGRCPLGVGSGCMLPQGIWYKLWSWLTFGLKNVFIRTFKDGHSNPAERPSLEELQKALEVLLFCMQKEPARTHLEPPRAKSAERKSSSTGPTSGARRPFNVYTF